MTPSTKEPVPHAWQPLPGCRSTPADHQGAAFTRGTTRRGPAACTAPSNAVTRALTSEVPISTVRIEMNPRKHGTRSHCPSRSQHSSTAISSSTTRASGKPFAGPVCRGVRAPVADHDDVELTGVGVGSQRPQKSEQSSALLVVGWNHHTGTWDGYHWAILARRQGTLWTPTLVAQPAETARTCHASEKCSPISKIRGPMPKRRVLVVYGTLPEAIKMAPVIAALRASEHLHPFVVRDRAAP